ncbi:hypothetical protein OEZ85_002281 [Tetradesmus obliquus]|uniref:Uncharacterized protein n=1 Tax=Tetradesmus obliquus TaxID=3088 RepID=A0ABY8U2S3_TETOB|nr:hypothetical protein OEZ85_002281 [Tetradesmus obliquus]
MINQCSQQLLAIPGVPYAAAEALVAAGLRAQITAQQLLALAYEHYEWVGVWADAFAAAGVPLQEWAAGIPADLRGLCCCMDIFAPDDSDEDAAEHVQVQDLTPAHATDLLAITLSVAASRKAADNDHLMNPLGCDALTNIVQMYGDPAYTTILSTTAVEALLRLAVQLHSRNPNELLASAWLIIFDSLVKLPAAAQLTNAAVVELAQHAVQSLGDNAAMCGGQMLRMLAGRQLSAEQLEALLSLLQRPTENITAALCQGRCMPGRSTVIKWLASQPGAAAAAARLGLTAADVGHRAAAALLFGSEAAGAADGLWEVSSSESDSDDEFDGDE